MSLYSLISQLARDLENNYGPKARITSVTVTKELHRLLEAEVAESGLYGGVGVAELPAGITTRLYVNTYAGRITIEKEKTEPTPIQFTDVRDWKPSAVRDEVLAPRHYSKDGKQVWDTMQDLVPADEYRGYLTLNVVKYVSRFQQKNGKQDLLKARAYIDKLIEKEYGNEV